MYLDKRDEHYCRTCKACVYTTAEEFKKLHSCCKYCGRINNVHCYYCMKKK